MVRYINYHDLSKYGVVTRKVENLSQMLIMLSVHSTASSQPRNTSLSGAPKNSVRDITIKLLSWVVRFKV